MKKIELFGSSTKSLSNFLSAQTRLNCLMWIIKDGEKNIRFAPFGTPGLTSFSTGLAGPVQGWHLGGNGLLYIAAGGIAYSVATNGTASVLGTLASAVNPVGIEDNSTQAIFVDGIKGWILTKIGGAFNQITDPSFPNGTSSVAYNDSYFICPQIGSNQYWISSPGDGTTWNAFNGDAETYSDTLVKTSVLHGIVIHWKSTSIEFHQDQGIIPFPYSGIPSTTADWGLAAYGSAIKYNNTMAFLATNRESGQYQLMELDGFTPVPLPNSDDILQIINSFTTVSDAVALSYVYNGHNCYQITFPTANRSFVYDNSTKYWSEAQTGTSTPPNRTRHIGQYSIQYGAKTLVSDYNVGNIYYQDPLNFTDNGTAIRREVTSRVIDDDGNQFICGELWLDMERGNTSVSVSPQLNIEVSTDYGNTWNLNRIATIYNIASSGQYFYPRLIARRFGAMRALTFRFSMTDPAPFVFVRGCATITTGSQSGR